MLLIAPLCPAPAWQTGQRDPGWAPAPAAGLVCCSRRRCRDRLENTSQWGLGLPKNEQQWGEQVSRAGGLLAGFAVKKGRGSVCF